MDTQRSLADRLWTLETRNRRMGIALKAIGVPAAIAFALFGLPIVGNIVMMLFAELLDCSSSGAGPPTCMLAGVDIGDVVYNYGISLLFLGLFNVFYLYQLLNKFLPGVVLFLWFGGLVALPILRWEVSREIKALKAAQLSDCT